MTLTLFAETSDGGVAALVTLATLLSGGVVWLANYLNQKHKQSREERKEDEKSIVDHYIALNARIDRENDLLRQEIESVRVGLTSAISHVRYLEGIMESKSIPFRPFDLTQLGSSIHRPLPEINGE